MSEASGTAGVDASGLRERLPQQPDAPQKAASVETAQDAVRQLNQQEADKDEKDKRTYGRTPDGTGAYSRSLLARLHLYPTYFVASNVANRMLSILNPPSRAWGTLT